MSLLLAVHSSIRFTLALPLTARSQPALLLELSLNTSEALLGRLPDLVSVFLVVSVVAYEVVPRSCHLAWAAVLHA